MSKIFSARTLGEFEAASASIPLRPLVRAFEAAAIRQGNDPGGPDGARKAQFRRYIAGVDQHDPQQLDRLGAALGALIDEVATSKQEFLVRAAERDGFRFVDGAFRPADAAPSSSPSTRAEIIADAKEQFETACRTVLRQLGETAPKKGAGLADIARSTLAALDRGRTGPKKR